MSAVARTAPSMMTSRRARASAMNERTTTGRRHRDRMSDVFQSHDHVRRLPASSVRCRRRRRVRAPCRSPCGRSRRRWNDSPYGNAVHLSAPAFLKHAAIVVEEQSSSRDRRDAALMQALGGAMPLEVSDSSSRRGRGRVRSRAMSRCRFVSHTRAQRSAGKEAPVASSRPRFPRSGSRIL